MTTSNGASAAGRLIDRGRDVGDVLLLGRAEEPDRQVEAVEADPANVPDGRVAGAPDAIDERRDGVPDRSRDRDGDEQPAPEGGLVS